MEERFVLGRYGAHLWTREKAREIKAVLAQQLCGLEVGGALTIDAGGVDVFDYSFASELFGKTVLSLPYEHPGRFVIVEDLTDYARENLTRALEGMNLAMIERRRGGLHLIGKVHPADEASFAAIVRAGRPITATELGQKLAIKLNAMNERLSKLLSLGLVRRERSASTAGRQRYEYVVVA